MTQSDKSTEQNVMVGTEDQRSICIWAEAIFGPVADPMALARRAMMEMDELSDAITARDVPEIGREAADVVILLMRLADQYGLDLMAQVQSKMAINRARTWSAKGDGTGSHI